jgi:hypothetical protein
MVKPGLDWGDFANVWQSDWLRQNRKVKIELRRICGHLNAARRLTLLKLAAIVAVAMALSQACLIVGMMRKCETL